MAHCKDIEQVEHYRQQASACGAAALRTPIPDIRQAYLELEQGWLCLSPKPKKSSDDSTEFRSANGGTAGDPLNETAGHAGDLRDTRANTDTDA